MEPCGYNGSYGVVLCHPNHHHATEYEVQQCEVHKEDIPEEFSNCPLEPHHGIHYGSIYAGLNQRVRQLDQNLQYSLQTLTVVTRSSKVTLHFRQDMFSQCIEGDKVCRAT